MFTGNEINCLFLPYLSRCYQRYWWCLCLCSEYLCYWCYFNRLYCLCLCSSSTFVGGGEPTTDAFACFGAESWCKWYVLINSIKGLSLLYKWIKRALAPDLLCSSCLLRWGWTTFPRTLKTSHLPSRLRLPDLRLPELPLKLEWILEANLLWKYVLITWKDMYLSQVVWLGIRYIKVNLKGLDGMNFHLCFFELIVHLIKWLVYFLPNPNSLNDGLVGFLPNPNSIGRLVGLLNLLG